jgi:hypothetical protein
MNEHLQIFDWETEGDDANEDDTSFVYIENYFSEHEELSTCLISEALLRGIKNAEF